jgi:hypothetical protein
MSPPGDAAVSHPLCECGRDFALVEELQVISPLWAEEMEEVSSRTQEPNPLTSSEPGGGVSEEPDNSRLDLGTTQTGIIDGNHFYLPSVSTDSALRENLCVKWAHRALVTGLPESSETKHHDAQCMK